MNVLMIDSGTSTTRVRLIKNNEVTTSVSRNVGSKDVSINGCNSILKNSIKECIVEILEKTQIQVDDIHCMVGSGMITSNVGLIDLPHISGPAGIDELATNIVEVSFPSIIEKPIYLIPGIKIGFNPEKGFMEKDIIRGEESEIMGYFSNFSNTSNDNELLFVHYGSHHKCIRVKNKRIVGSFTSITGELMHSILNHTVLNGSLLPLDELNHDIEWVKKGIEAANSQGAGRALFLTRILDVMDGKSKQDSTNFFIGVLISLDLQFINDLITPNTEKIVLYGKKLFPSIFSNILREKYPWLDIEIVSEEESELLSVYGALDIYNNYTLRRI